MQRYKNLLKLNILSNAISNIFLVMNRQIWINQKRHLSTASADEPASALLYVHYVARLRTPCTSCLSVLGALNLYGNYRRGNHCLDKAGLPDSTVQYNIYDGQAPWQHAGQVMAWFQEIKRDLIYHRFKIFFFYPLYVYFLFKN